MKRMIIGMAAACAFFAMPAMASAHACCDDAKKAACCEDKAACCRHDNDPAATAVLIPAVGHDQAAARPAREQVLVKFWNPVRVGDKMLMGKYVIEHDTERMARGGPCTYIYEFGKSLPVVAFHCVHLDRPLSQRATVTLRPANDPSGTKILTEFQFSGESAGHGVPGLRH